MEIAVLALGCFWGPEIKYSKIPGIIKTEVGYCGGDKPKVTYNEVCTGETNHAEVVKIEFDEKIITYENLLNKFFEMHDPTTLNRQGPDIGTQYRSEIFFINDKQKKIAEETKLIFDKKYDGKIKTNISKEINYCKAEDYHQKYIQKRN